MHGLRPPNNHGRRLRFLSHFFAEQFLDLHTRHHGDGIPGAFFFTNSTTGTHVPVDNDNLVRAIPGIIRVIDLIDTIDRTEIDAPLTASTSINIDPRFRTRSTSPSRPLSHTYLLRKPPLSMQMLSF
jgi:hypothetical protein